MESEFETHLKLLFDKIKTVETVCILGILPNFLTEISLHLGLTRVAQWVERGPANRTTVL
jgi:hypothetical protein